MSLGRLDLSPQCQYEERLVGETTECVISERECGCVFWQAVGDLVEGIINEENDDNCDVCLPVFRNSTSGSMSSYYHRRDAAGSTFLMALLIAFFGSWPLCVLQPRKDGRGKERPCHICVILENGCVLKFGLKLAELGCLENQMLQKGNFDNSSLFEQITTGKLIPVVTDDVQKLCGMCFICKNSLSK